MNSNLPHQLAAELKANPSFFEDIDEALLCDIVFNHAQGLLSEDDAAEVETLLRTNAKAQAIRERLHDTDRFMATEMGRVALNDLLERAVPAKTGRQSAATTTRAFSEVFFTRLSTWIAETFTELRLQGAYADTTVGQRKVFSHAAGDPYKPWLVQDRMGRWYLRVVTEDAEAAKVRLRLELECEMPVLEFQLKGDGEFFAEVRLTEAMAEALKLGHRPVFHPVE